MLSLFIKYQFGICAICFISTNQNKIRVRENSEAAFSSEFRLKLIPQICRCIVEKFNAVAAWQRKSKIDKASDKRVQFFNPRHPLDMKVVDLRDQLLLERLKLSVIQ